MKISRKISYALAVPALTLTTAVFAVDDLSYDYLEARYAETEIETLPGDIEGDGWQFSGLFELSDSVHLLAGYERFEFDDNLTISTTVFGGGFAFGVAPTTDIILRAGFVDGTVDDGFGEFSDEGFLLSAGVRSLITPDIELHGTLQTVNFDNIGEEEQVTVGAEFYLNDGFSIGPSVTWVEDTTTVSVGARFFF